MHSYLHYNTYIAFDNLYILYSQGYIFYPYTLDMLASLVSTTLNISNETYAYRMSHNFFHTPSIYNIPLIISRTI